MGKKSKSRVEKEHGSLEHIPEYLESDGDSKFARALGSGDYHTRDRGLKALVGWLQLLETIDFKSLQKLWKGLMFCFWHADKAPVQADLALRLAGILLLVKDEVRSLALSPALF
jgi:ribosomal RNA-processing protein 1